MAGEQIIYTSERLADYTTAKLNNMFAAQYDAEVDKMFGRLHETEPLMAYNPNDFTRVAFEDKKVAAQFKEELSKKGVAVSVSKTKLNGLYVAEVPKATPIITNTAATTVNNPFLSNSNNLITSDELIKNFETTTQKQVLKSSEIKDYCDAHGYSKAADQLPKTDQLFEKMYKDSQTKQLLENYNPDNYTRVAFSNKDAANRFYQEMTERGVDVAVSPSRLNGQYLAEIPKECKAKEDTYLKKVADPNYVPSATPKYEYKTSSELINDFKAKTFEDIREVKESEQVQAGGSPINPRQIVGEMTSQMDELGTVINVSYNVTRTLNQFKKNANKEIFNKEQINGKLQYNTGLTQKAIVLNDNVVVINGKIVTSGKDYDFVMQQHQERIKKADKIINSSQVNVPVVGKQSQIRHSNAKKIKDDMYRQEYRSREVVSMARRQGGILDYYVNSFNTENIALAQSSLEVGKLTSEEIGFFDKMLQKGSISPFNTIERLSSDEMTFFNKILKDGHLAADTATELTDILNNRYDNIVSHKDKETIQNAVTEIQEKIKNGKLVLSDKDKVILAGILGSNRNLAPSETAISLADIINNKSDKIIFYKDKFVIQDSIKLIQENVKRGSLVLSDKDKRILEDMKKEDRHLILSDKEMHTFTQTRSIIKSLEKDLGLNFSKSGIGRADILKINEVFLKKSEAAGYQFVVVKLGKAEMDIKALKALGASDLAKLGISKETLDVIVAFNEKGAWGDVKKGDGTLSYFLMSGFLKLTDDDELSEAISGLRKTTRIPKHIRTVATSAKQAKNAAQYKAGEIKAKASNLLEKNGYKPKTSKPKKVKPNAAATRKIDSKANAKLLKQNEKKARKLARSEKSVVTKTKTGYKTIVKRFADNSFFASIKAIKAKASKFLLSIGKWIGLGILIIIGGIVAIIAVVTLIQSFFNFANNALAPETYQDTVCYKLYEYLAEEEQCWLQDTEDIEALFKNRDKVKYGASYKPYKEYLASIHFLEERNGILYINPYASNRIPNYTIPTSTLIPITEFDGTATTEIGTNISGFNKLKKTATEPEMGAENGHTSNVKEIIAMIDVMYQFDVDSNSDKDLQSVLGMSPAQVNLENFKNKTWGTIKWAGNNIGVFFKRMFGSEESYSERAEWVSDDTCSYKTIRDYAMMLFETSHQNEYALSIKYCNVKDKLKINVGGKNISINADSDVELQRRASEFNTCLNPVTHSYQIAYSNSEYPKIFPCVKTSDGKLINLTKDCGNFRISIADNCTDTKNLCLWEDMGSNKATLDKIKKNSCWVGTSSKSAVTAAATGAAGNSKTAAYNNVIAELQKKYNSTASNINSLSKSNYVLSSDHNKFTASYPAMNTSWKNSVYNVTYQKFASSAGTEPSYYYLLKNGSSDKTKWTMTVDETRSKTPIYYFFDVPSSLQEPSVLASMQEKYRFYKMVSTGSSYSYKDYSDKISDKNKIACASGRKIIAVRPMTTVQYKATAYATLYNNCKDVYTRKCKGHEFKFCGGHICVESNGIVYSASNEQLAAIEAFPNKKCLPIANDADVKAYLKKYYGDIIGKHGAAGKVDYSSLWKATATGGGLNPRIDPQGSVATYGKGLNLYVDAATKQFLPDYGVLSDNMIRCFKDIFDADCILLKGNNVFPWGSKYEKYAGWDSDNMSLVLTRISQDWYDLYDFDIPYELETKALSEKDIKAITKALKKQYGYSFTESKQEAVEWALYWVGRGHYSSDFSLAGVPFLNKNISVLSNATTDTFYLNNTASDSSGFIKFLLNRNGKPFMSIPSGSPYSGTSLFLPADILYHSGGNLDEMVFDKMPTGKNLYKVLDAIGEYKNDSYVMVIGVLGEDVTLYKSPEVTKTNEDGSKEEVEIETDEVVLKKGTLLTVDFTQKGKNNIGTIRLNYNDPEDWTSYIDDPNSHLYWIQHPDSYSSRLRIF